MRKKRRGKTPAFSVVVVPPNGNKRTNALCDRPRVSRIIEKSAGEHRSRSREGTREDGTCEVLGTRIIALKTKEILKRKCLFQIQRRCTTKQQRGEKSAKVVGIQSQSRSP